MIVGLTVLIVFILIAIFAPWLEPYDPRAKTGAVYEPPSSAHWLGTDDGGADMVVFHLEAASDPLDVIERIRAERRAAGLALRLDTAIEDVPEEVLAAVDLVNLVAVPLGYGGSASAADTFERISALRRRTDDAGMRLGIEVDGGVKPETARRYVDAGADMLTVGTGIYRAPDVDAAVRTLRETSRVGDTSASSETIFCARPDMSTVSRVARYCRWTRR